MPSIDDLSDVQKKAITDSWAPVRKDAKTLGTEFFVKLFKDYPYTEDRFPQFKGKALADLQKDKMMKAHAVSVLGGVTNFVDNLNDADTFEGLVRKMTVHHHKRDVGPKDFVNAANTLVDFLTEKLGGACGPDVQAAWKAMWAIWIGYSEDAAKDL